LLAEVLVLCVFILTKIPEANFKIGFLWLNPIGAFGVIIFSLLLNPLMKNKKPVVIKQNIQQESTRF
ncbi:MAG: hypothetical protein ACTHMD_14940, partial [Flavisolibacter sp.]